MIAELNFVHCKWCDETEREKKKKTNQERYRFVKLFALGSFHHYQYLTFARLYRSRLTMSMRSFCLVELLLLLLLHYLFYFLSSFLRLSRAMLGAVYWMMIIGWLSEVVYITKISTAVYFCALEPLIVAKFFPPFMNKMLLKPINYQSKKQRGFTISYRIFLLSQVEAMITNQTWFKQKVMPPKSLPPKVISSPKELLLNFVRNFEIW